MRFHTFPKVQASPLAGPGLVSSRICLGLVPLLVSSFPNGVVVISPYLRAGSRAYMFPSPFSARLWGGGNSCRPLLRALNGTPNGQIGSSYYPHVFYLGLRLGPSISLVGRCALAPQPTPSSLPYIPQARRTPVPYWPFKLHPVEGCDPWSHRCLV